MVSNLGNVSPTGSEGVPPAQPIANVTPDAQTAGLAATGNKLLTKADSNTKIADMGQLHEKAPEIEKAMLEGIATNIVNEMKRQEDKRRERAREAQR